MNKGNKEADFSGYLGNLESDLKILVACLAATIFLPYLRNYDIPLISYPDHDLMPSKGKMFTAAELFVVVLSLSLIVEVISCMILVVKQSLKSNNT